MFVNTFSCARTKNLYVADNAMTYEGTCAILPNHMDAVLNPADRVRDRLRRWIETTKIGQRELAGDLKKTQVWLQKVLAGENHIRLRDLDDVASAMRTTASELVRGDEDRYQYELAPTEVRIIEHIRHRPETLYAIATLLRIDLPKPPPPKNGQARHPPK